MHLVRGDRRRAGVDTRCRRRGGRQAVSRRHRHLPVRGGCGAVRGAGAQRRRGGRRSAQCRYRGGALCEQGHRRSAPGDHLRRRGRRNHQAGHGVPQSRSAEERRRGDRLHLERRLPGDRASRRGTEEAQRVLRLRHAAHLRGCKLQVPVPDGGHCDDRQRGRRALPEPAQEEHPQDRRHQPELRLGPGLVERLRGRDESARSQRPDRHLADAQAPRRAIRRRDLRAPVRGRRRRSLELLGRRPGRADPPGRSTRAVQEEHGRADRRRDRSAEARRSDPRRHDHRRARAIRHVRARYRAESLVPQGLHRPLQRPAYVPVVQDGPGNLRPQGRVREGPGRSQGRTFAGADHRRVRTSDLREPRRHGDDGVSERVTRPCKEPLTGR